MCGEALDPMVLGGADHDDIYHPRYDSCRILDRLSSAELSIIGGEE